MTVLRWRGFSFATFARASGARMPSRLTATCDFPAGSFPALRTVTRTFTFAPAAGAAEGATATTVRSARLGFPAAAAGATENPTHATRMIRATPQQRRAGIFTAQRYMTYGV